MVESRQIEKGRKGFMSVGRKGGLLYSGGPGVRNMGNPVLFPVQGMDTLTTQRWRSGDKITVFTEKTGGRIRHSHTSEHENTMCLQCLAMVGESSMVGPKLVRTNDSPCAQTKHQIREAPSQEV